MDGLPVRFYEKAERALDAAGRLLAGGDADFAASRAYYAMLYSADALLMQRGMRFQEHAASHDAFDQHVVRTGAIDEKYHHWLTDGFERRLRADYSVDAPFPTEEATLMIDWAREFVREAGRLLNNSDG